MRRLGRLGTAVLFTAVGWVSASPGHAGQIPAPKRGRRPLGRRGDRAGGAAVAACTTRRSARYSWASWPRRAARRRRPGGTGRSCRPTSASSTSASSPRRRRVGIDSSSPLGRRGGRERGRAEERVRRLRPPRQRAGRAVRSRLLGHRGRRAGGRAGYAGGDGDAGAGAARPGGGHEPALRPLEQAGARGGFADRAAGGRAHEGAGTTVARGRRPKVRRKRTERRDGPGRAPATSASGVGLSATAPTATPLVGGRRAPWSGRSPRRSRGRAPPRPSARRTHAAPTGWRTPRRRTRAAAAGRASATVCDTGSTWTSIPRAASASRRWSRPSSARGKSTRVPVGRSPSAATSPS